MVRKGGGLERLELCGHDLYRWSKDPRRPNRREGLRPARGGISRRVRAVPMVRREPRRKTGLERRGQRAAPTRTRRDEPRLARRAPLGAARRARELAPQADGDDAEFGHLHLSPRRWFTHALHPSLSGGHERLHEGCGLPRRNSGYEG